MDFNAEKNSSHTALPHNVRYVRFGMLQSDAAKSRDADVESRRFDEKSSFPGIAINRLCSYKSVRIKRTCSVLVSNTTYFFFFFFFIILYL